MGGILFAPEELHGRVTAKGGPMAKLRRIRQVAREDLFREKTRTWERPATSVTDIYDAFGEGDAAAVL
jgi:hypothetical protein